MVILVTSKNEEDPIKLEGARVATIQNIDFLNTKNPVTPGVLVAFSRRSTKMQNAKVNAVRTPWTPWQRGGNSIERRGKS